MSTLTSFRVIDRRPRTTLFPYTTLFRSRDDRDPGVAPRAPRRARLDRRAEMEVLRFKCSRCEELHEDRKSTRLNSSHSQISYAVFCLKKKTRSESTQPMKPNSSGRDSEH